MTPEDLKSCFNQCRTGKKFATGLRASFYSALRHKIFRHKIERENSHVPKSATQSVLVKINPNNIFSVAVPAQKEAKEKKKPTKMSLSKFFLSVKE